MNTAKLSKTNNLKPTMSADSVKPNAASSSSSSSSSSTKSNRGGAAMSVNLKVDTHKANSRPRLGRLPSLKQISERLATNTNPSSTVTNTTSAGTTSTATVTTATAAKTNTTGTTASSTASTTTPASTSTTMVSTSAADPLTDVTTTTANLPLPAMSLPRSVSPSGRLKLPASAMTRANLNPSFAKVESEPRPEVKESQKKDTKDATPTEASPVSNEPEELKITRDGAEPLGARASLGHGLPALGDGAGDSITAAEVVVRKSTPGLQERYTNANGEHPLGHNWTLHYDSKTYKPAADTVKTDTHLSSWEANLLKVGTFNTVEGFARHMNNIRLPSTLAKGANYHLFKDNIRPMWEDPANHKGGKWVMFCRGLSLFDMCWANLVMALVGETLDHDNKVCGIVASARPKLDRIQVWTSVADDVEYLNNLAQRLLDTLGLDSRETDNISLEFTPHSASAKIPPGLTKLTLSAPVSRSISLANIAQNGDNRLRRSPSSPGGSFGGSSSTHTSTHGPSPLAAGSAPMRRTGSAGASAFSGPLGAARRLASTTADAL